MQHHLLFCFRKIFFFVYLIPSLFFGLNLSASYFSENLPSSSTSFKNFEKSVAFCTPISTNANQFINEIKFLGTLNGDIANVTGFSGSGYANYTSLPQKAKQIPGGVVNVNVRTSNARGIILSTTKAWVDWNKNEIFEQTSVEKVYDISQIGAMSGNVIFGFVVPMGTPAGFYTIRIRSSGTDNAFNACNTIQSGEAEDYTFEVINECKTLITAVEAKKRCGSGQVILNATADSSVVSYQWFDSEFGEAIAGEISNTYTTAHLEVGVYTYYVSAFNGLCYSTFRTPVKVVVSPTPTIQFTQSFPEICGPIASTIITSTADKEEVTLLEEHFDNTSENPVQFENSYAGNINPDGRWQLRASPYVPQAPPYYIVKPAISSGYNGGNFANIITDVRQTANILNHFTLKQPLNTVGFTDLKLDFDLYFFSEEDLETKNYFLIQYSINGGANWIDLKKYISDVGIPSRFKHEIIDLPQITENKSQFLIRFTAFALGTNNEWMADIVALDNIKIYGNREVPTNFTWSANTDLFDSTCSAPADLIGSPSICIKPSEQDNKTKTQFSITASATLSNGCRVSGTLNIANNNKYWDSSTSENWAEANWQPANNIPDITKCVIIKKPVSILENDHFEAKNVKIASGGKLNVNANSSLTIQDAIINEGSEQNMLIESGGNLVQINDEVNLNSAIITANKLFEISSSRRQFNYFISPLEGQNLKTIYPGITSVITYNEATNFFSKSNGDYKKGYGLAIKEPDSTFISLEENEVTAKFIGNVTNGTFSIPIVNSNPSNGSRGFNLVGNPYPSMIDLIKLYQINDAETGDLNATFYFWDSSVNDIYVQQGTHYGGQSYGQFNALNGTGTPATGDLSTITKNIPTRYVSVGTGFMAKSKVSTMNLKFQNSIRIAQPLTNHEISKTHSDKMDRFWVSLISPTNVASTIAVVYFPAGNSGLAQDDTVSLMGSDAIFSLVEDKNISINGKNSFTKNDRVKLGTSHFIDGFYKIKLVKKEGIFENTQKIYLKDNQTGMIADLSQTSYTFSAQQGLNTGRFELVYQPEATLATDDFLKEEVSVHQQGNEFVLKSSTKNITQLEVYDASGRLVHHQTANNKEVRFNTNKISKGVFFLKIHQNEKIVTKKIIH